MALSSNTTYLITITLYIPYILTDATSIRHTFSKKSA